jgi:hypothetical protein
MKLNAKDKIIDLEYLLYVGIIGNELQIEMLIEAQHKVALVDFTLVNRKIEVHLRMQGNDLP